MKNLTKTEQANLIKSFEERYKELIGNGGDIDNQQSDIYELANEYAKKGLLIICGQARLAIFFMDNYNSLASSISGERLQGKVYKYAVCSQGFDSNKLEHEAGNISNRIAKAPTNMKTSYGYTYMIGQELVKPLHRYVDYNGKVVRKDQRNKQALTSILTNTYHYDSFIEFAKEMWEKGYIIVDVAFTPKSIGNVGLVSVNGREVIGTFDASMFIKIPRGYTPICGRCYRNGKAQGEYHLNKLGLVVASKESVMESIREYIETDELLQISSTITYECKDKKHVHDDVSLASDPDSVYFVNIKTGKVINTRNELIDVVKIKR